MSLVVLIPLLLFIYYCFPFQRACACEVQTLKNFCIFIMLLYCLLAHFSGCLHKKLTANHLLQGLSLQNSGRNITILKEKKIFLTLIHNLSAKWNISAQISERKSKQQQQQCIPGMGSPKGLGKAEAGSKSKFPCWVFFFPFLFSSLHLILSPFHLLNKIF